MMVLVEVEVLQGEGRGTLKTLISFFLGWGGIISVVQILVLGLYFHEQKPLCFEHNFCVKQCYGFYHVLLLGHKAPPYNEVVKSIALLVKNAVASTHENQSQNQTKIGPTLINSGSVIVATLNCGYRFPLSIQNGGRVPGRPADGRRRRLCRQRRPKKKHLIEAAPFGRLDQMLRTTV